MQQTDWVAALFRAIDAKDSDAFGEFLSEDVVFRFGNAPPVAGKRAAVEAVRQFFAGIAALGHNVLETWSGPGSVICRGEVSYTRHDGKEVTLPFADYFGLDGEKICNYQIFIDINPLFADS